MPWCITCAEVEHPDWQERYIYNDGYHHLHHKYLTWREYWQHKFSKKFKGHKTYV